MNVREEFWLKIREYAPNLSDDVMCGWLQNPNHMKRIVQNGLCEFASPMQMEKLKHLELLGQPTMITLSACRHFNVLQKFQKDPFFIMHASFEKQVTGIEEENIPETKYAYRKLLLPSIDEKILSALSDKRKGEDIKVFYTHIYEYLKNCPNGWYIFYAGDGMVVGVDWRGDGWSLHAYSVEYPHGWGDGILLVSREILKT